MATEARSNSVSIVCVTQSMRSMRGDVIRGNRNAIFFGFDFVLWLERTYILDLASSGGILSYDRAAQGSKCVGANHRKVGP
jgi:2-polyprenyl-3-methyl-5-hydroxy-6-metoxy-1,4-benzoquinol methylase